MALDLAVITPAARTKYLKLGRQFSAEEALAQANKTLAALVKHGAKLVDYGFGVGDGEDLKDARGLIVAAGVGREQKRSLKKETSQACTDAFNGAQAVRLRGRAVLTGGRRVLAQSGSADDAAAVRAIDAVLQQTSAAPWEDVDKLATQCDSLRLAFGNPLIAAATKDRGGPKVVTDLEAHAATLRATSQSAAGSAGTPAETEQLDLIEGVIVSLTRSARVAAKAASKALGQPALLKEFELGELYASRGGATSASNGAKSAKPSDGAPKSEAVKGEAPKGEAVKPVDGKPQGNAAPAGEPKGDAAKPAEPSKDGAPQGSPAADP